MICTLYSYKNPKIQKVIYRIFCDDPCCDPAPTEIVQNNKIYSMYGEIAKGTYSEMEKLKE